MRKIRKRITLSACLVMCLSLLYGCGGSWELELSSIDTDTIYVSEDGSIELANVEEFDKDYYSKSQLEDFIKETIDTYKESEDSGEVTMEDFSVKDEVAKVLLKFDSAQTYADFQGMDFQVVHTEDIQGNLVLPESFVSADDSSNVSKDTVIKEKGLKLLIVNEPLHVQLDGTIKYYSEASITGDNVAETTGEKTAIIVYE